MVIVVVFNKFYLEVAPRWQRNSMGRPLSSLQIHQKIIWMLSNFHETTSEHWWRTPGTQKDNPFSLKGGRTKYERQKERQKLTTESRPREGVMKEKFPNSRKPSHWWICGEFWNLKGKNNQEGKKKKKPTEYAPNYNPSGEAAQTLTSTTSEWGLDREAPATCSG